MSRSFAAARGLVIAAIVVALSLRAGLEVSASEADSPSDATPSKFRRSFPEVVTPFVQRYCLDCHGEQDPEAMLDLSRFDSPDGIAQRFETWETVSRRVEAGEMPPQASGYTPTPEERDAFLAWITGFRKYHAARNAGEPGEVLARRLSAAEYDRTIRDLTGIDIRPAREFPVDPANEAGFDNSGESLMMTPSLLRKYLAAARTVSEHLLLTPDGLEFAPHPVVTDTDRDKFCVRRIVDFYERQNTDTADYFYAAWRLRGEPEADAERLASVAEDDGLSPKYLRTIRDLLAGGDDDWGPIATLRRMFAELPDDDAAAARRGCGEMRDYVRDVRLSFGFDFPHLRVDGINRGSQTLVLWRNRKMAGHRMKLNRDVLSDLAGGDSPAEKALNALPDGVPRLPEDPERRTRAIAALERFCRVFPDRFYVDRRGRQYLNRKGGDASEAKVRLLSAGFHSMMGYFRDDQPLVALLLDREQQRQLDRLWFELNFIANAPERQHRGFIWFERAEGRYLVDAEFDAFRSEDDEVTSEKMIDALAKAYIAKAKRTGAGGEAIRAMRDHFRIINASIREVEAARPAARKAHLRDLVAWTERAYRRPLSEADREGIVAYYHELVNEDGLGHTDAIRDVLVSVLMSPHFCYRLHESDVDKPIHRLSNHALASRLSYFLWSSMPDERLIRLAGEGRLHDPGVLRAEVARMLEDPRARGLAVEFGGHWLGFRHFLSHNSVDRGKFPEFDDELRQAMFEEPVRFTLDLIRNDRSVLEFLYADHTFVNRVLAKHYGIEGGVEFGPDGWTRIDNADRFGRGGLLPMSVFMTKHSPGLRTSPVKRGFWVVRQLLGEHIPAPPPDVPELPNDESQLGELTLRERLAEHREHASCAGCHEKFDSVGLVFEGYGPIGELRRNDLAGNAVDLSAEFPDGSRREGIGGLQTYLSERRQDEFVRTFCRKLLSYALGRSLKLSDDPLLDEMRRGLEANGYRFRPLVQIIVTSPQFKNQRGRAFRLEP